MRQLCFLQVQTPKDSEFVSGVSTIFTLSLIPYNVLLLLNMGHLTHTCLSLFVSDKEL